MMNKTTKIFKPWAVEADVVNFNGRLIVLYAPRTPHDRGKLISADYFTGERIAEASNQGLTLGCAMMIGGTLHYWGSTNVGASGNKVQHMSTTDLVNWTPAVDAWVAGHPQQKIFNTSVCTDGVKFYMAYETSEPYYGYVDFNIRFLQADTADGPWTPLGGVFGANWYVACPQIRHVGGNFYMHYLINDGGVFKTCIARISDLANSGVHTNWAHASKFALQPTLSEERNNTSDIDFCEFEGNTYFVYAAGDQGNTSANVMDLMQGYREGTIASYLAWLYS